MMAGSRLVALHQPRCTARVCGGTFVCDGCSRLFGWCLKPLVVAEELRDEGFLRFARNGRFALTERAREALQ